MVVVTTNVISMAESVASKEERVYLGLLRAAYGLEWEVGEVLKPRELSPTQYNLLRILREAGVEGLPCGEVGVRMSNRDPDVTRLLYRLERRGLVTRSRSRSDRRVIRAVITSAGRDLLKKLDRPVTQFIRVRMGRLDAGQLQILNRLLEQLHGQAPQ